MAPELKTFYDRNLLERLLPLLVFMNFGQVRPMPTREGQTVNFRRFNSLSVATTPLTEGVTPGSETPTITQLTASPVQYGSYIESSDILDFTSLDPVLTEFGQILAEQAAQYCYRQPLKQSRKARTRERPLTLLTSPERAHAGMDPVNGSIRTNSHRRRALRRRTACVRMPASW